MSNPYFPHLRTVSGAVLILVLAAGCTTFAPDERPEITLASLELTEATVFETTLAARVRISNPSLEPFVVEGATFKLVLDGWKVGRGMMKETMTVESLDSQVGTAIFHINNAAALLRFRDILEQQALEYGVIGNLYLQGSFGTTKVKVERMGRLAADETLGELTDSNPTKPLEVDS